MKQCYQSGQALIVILLVMAVGLTVGLASASRSITDIHISHQEEESARAFSVAETGIEQALLSQSEASGSVSLGGVDINYQVTVNSGGSTVFDFNGKKFAAGDTQSVWLVGHNADGEPDPSISYPPDGNVDVCWGSNAEDKLAVEVNLIYQNSDNSFGLIRGAFDADPIRGNNFDPSDNSSSCDDANLAFSEIIRFGVNKPGFQRLPVGAIPYLLRIKLLYNGEELEPLAVKARGGNTLPSQGKCYESTARVINSGVTRKVRQCQFYKAPPAIFDYSLYSESGLLK